MVGLDRHAQYPDLPVYHSFSDSTRRFFMLIGLLTGNGAKIVVYYFYLCLWICVALLAFSFEKEKKSGLFWLIPQRLVYRWLMWWVLFKSVRKAIKGEFQHWGVLKSTGNVREVVSEVAS